MVELTNCEDVYRNDIVGVALKIYSKDGYEADITVINEGLYVLNEDSILENKKEEYMKCISVSLSKFKVVDLELGFSEEMAIKDLCILYKTGRFSK